MPNYTTVTKVKAELPSDPPEDYNATTWQAVIEQVISENSQYVDDNVGGNYSFDYESATQKFPEIDSDPATPKTIEKISRYLCAAELLAYYSGIYTTEDNSQRLRRRNWAEETLEKIRSGEIQISISGSNLYSISVYSESDFTDPIFTETSLDEF